MSTRKVDSVCSEKSLPVDGRMSGFGRGVCPSQELQYSCQDERAHQGSDHALRGNEGSRCYSRRCHFSAFGFTKMRVGLAQMLSRVVCAGHAIHRRFQNTKHSSLWGRPQVWTGGYFFSAASAPKRSQPSRLLT